MEQDRLWPDEAVALVSQAFEASGVAEGNARSVARALVAAEVDGQPGHGLSRVPAYAAQARSGKVDGRAEPLVERRAPALLAVDARHGFAFPALDLALPALADLAAETGVAAATVTRSHHCGQLGAHVERLAERGCVALMVANTPKAMPPWGGHAPLFGTNPIAFAAPRPDDAPLVLDLSLSVVARGKVMKAAQAGEPIPEGWALDADGHPTTEARAALAGSMLPMAGPKGAALALMVEVLAGALTGASLSFEASSFFDADGAPPGVGQFVLAIDPGATSASYAERVTTLADGILAQDGVRLPGDRRHARRSEAAAKGIAVPAPLLADIRKLAARA